MNLINDIITQATQQGWIDWIITITALIYIVLAAKEKIWCWFWGIISCSFWAYASFALYDLYLDALLQIFYVIMGFIGIYQWKYGGAAQKKRPIQRMTWLQHLMVLLIGSVLALGFGYFFDHYTAAAATYLDAFTTIFAFITTFLLVWKYLDNWIYWVVIDFAYIYLYFSRGAIFQALIMVIYVIIAALAYYNWRVLMQEKQKYA